MAEKNLAGKMSHTNQFNSGKCTMTFIAERQTYIVFGTKHTTTAQQFIQQCM